MMSTREARADRDREMLRAKIAHRRLLASRKAFYVLAVGLLVGLTFFGFMVSMH